ncbi:iron ABC transporter permease [Telmatospirillum sp. J64-1]|uniref:FecCD family ABC transporter permease n=1 Tax=Telmatospirillum sp. J64-1 TaxID=2502183 RepID=UPI00115CC05D|nr:iron ABC transporter permease [Telmatospirillum sp. J64-1]
MSVAAAIRLGSSGWLAGLLVPAVLLLGVALAALTIGRIPVGFSDLIHVTLAALTGASGAVDPLVETVLLQVRLPRVLAALLVGAALASAGAAYQSMFRNPLVSPDILGVSSGAGLGAVIGILLSLPAVGIQAAAFIGGLVAVAVVYVIAMAVRRAHDPVLILVLAGVIVGSLLGAGISLGKYLADPYDKLPAITFWLLGSLASARLSDLPVLLPPVLLGLVPMVLLRWRINVMALDDEEARALGLRTGLLRALLIVAATLMTAAAVSTAGIVGWIGLVVPHLARMVAGPNFARLLPAAAMLGAGYLIAVDTLARTLAPVEIPLGVLNAFIGAPFFIMLLLRTRRIWA